MSSDDALMQVGEMVGVVRGRWETARQYRKRIVASMGLGSPCTRAGMEQMLLAMPGVRRVALLSAGIGGFAVVVEGGDEPDIRTMIDQSRAAGTTFELVVWPAPWWWRCWTAVCLVVVRVTRWAG